jgi:hypothetical protein
MSSPKLTQKSTPVETPVNGSVSPALPKQSSATDDFDLDSLRAPGVRESIGGELDISKFRIDQDYAGFIQARKTTVLVSVRRPDRQHWVCIHPSPQWRMPVAVLEIRDSQATYIVTPNIVPEVTGDLTRKWLVAYVTMQGDAGLWPIRMPDEMGRLDTYNESALRIVDQFAGRWIRILTNNAERRNDVLETQATKLPEPKWPEGGFAWMCATAFKGRVIDSLDHAVLRALRGEIQ